MKKLLLNIILCLSLLPLQSQSSKFHVSSYYKFNHSDSFSTYTAFKDGKDVDMGSFNTNFDLIFNHYTKKITLHDLNNDKKFVYNIIKVDTIGNNAISYFFYCDGFVCSYCVFDNTPTEKMILYGYKKNDRIYGWQAVSK